MPFSEVTFHGRWLLEPSAARASAPATSFSFAFEGRSLAVELEGEARFRIEIDGVETGELRTRERNLYVVAQNLEAGLHQASIVKKTETELGCISLFRIQPEPIPRSPSEPNSRSRLEFIGDSYTVGFGNMARDPITGTAFTTTDATRSYGAPTAGAVSYRIIWESLPVGTSPDSTNTLLAAKRCWAILLLGIFPAFRQTSSACSLASTTGKENAAIPIPSFSIRPTPTF